MQVELERLISMIDSELATKKLTDETRILNCGTWKTLKLSAMQPGYTSSVSY